MKHKRFSEEQIIGVLKEHEAGGRVDEFCLHLAEEVRRDGGKRRQAAARA